MITKAFALNWFLILAITVHQYSASTTNDVKESVEKPVKHRLNALINELEYKNYLSEVVEILRSDDEFNNKHFATMHEGLKSGSVAEHLHRLSPDIRSKLDEAKRLELDRIRRLAEELQKRGQTDSAVREHVLQKSLHLDIDQISKFDKEDLRRLIVQSNEDIAYLDKIRVENFKIYEMQKQLEFEELMKRLSPEMKEKVEKNVYDLYLRHRLAQPIRMPGSKTHLMKVWEHHDRMSKESFNAETFFRLHDLDSNGMWDEIEIKILIDKEVNSYYNKKDKDYDPKEKQEEIDRMREYTFGEMDKDLDHLVSLDEFIEYSKSTSFEDDQYWNPLKNIPYATEKEFEEYAKEHRAETIRRIELGLIKLPLSGVVEHEDDNKLDGYNDNAYYRSTNRADEIKLNQL